jgi:hypothetical protein
MTVATLQQSAWQTAIDFHFREWLKSLPNSSNPTWPSPLRMRDINVDQRPK